MSKTNIDSIDDLQSEISRLVDDGQGHIARELFWDAIQNGTIKSFDEFDEVLSELVIIEVM